MRNGLTQRQLCAALFAAMLLPAVTLLCSAGWATAAAAPLLAAPLYAVLLHGAKQERTLPQRCVDALGRPLGKAALLLAALAFSLLAGRLAARSTDFFTQTRGAGWAGFGLLLLAAWAASKGTATVVRCACILLPPLAAAFGAVVLCALPSVQAAWLRPQPAAHPEAAVLCLLLPGAAAFLTPQIRVRDARPVLWLLSFAAGATAAAAAAAGVLSPALAAGKLPFYTLARSITVFGVMVRLEALISGAMTACAFVGCALLLCAAAQAAGPCSVQTGAGLVWALAAVAAAAAAIPTAVPLRVFLTAGGIFCGGFPVLIQGIAVLKNARKKVKKR